MKFGTYRSIAMKSVGTKAAKSGLRLLAKSTQHVNECKATVGLNLGVSHLFNLIKPYLLGAQINEELRHNTLTPMSEIGYNLMILARSLKLKVPTATKKVKLHGSLTEGLLTLQLNSAALLDYVDGVFAGPVTKMVEKEITLPAEGGKKVMRQVAVLDAETEAAHETARQEMVKSLVQAVVDVYWPLCYSLTGKEPVHAFQISYDFLKEKYPDLFEGVEEGEETEAEEIAA